MPCCSWVGRHRGQPVVGYLGSRRHTAGDEPEGSAPTRVVQVERCGASGQRRWGRHGVGALAEATTEAAAEGAGVRDGHAGTWKGRPSRVHRSDLECHVVEQANGHVADGWAPPGTTLFVPPASTQ